MITAEGFDVQVWESVDAVTAFLCQPGDAGRAWTEDGHPVIFSAARGRPPIRALVSDDLALDELRSVLEGFLEHVGTTYDEAAIAGEAGSAPLRELVDQVAAWESPRRRHRKDSLRNRIAWYVLFRRT